MANNLGSLIVSLGLDAAEFTKGMSKSEYEAFKSTEKIKSQFMALGKYVAGLGIGAALVQSIRSTADYADEIGKLAQRAGTSAEDISKLAYAARQADVDNGQLAKGLRALGEDALTGGEKLAALGIKTTDASGKAKSSAQLFSEVADKIADMEDPQKKAAAAAELLGSKLGPELIPLLNQGAAGLKSSADEAARFGRVVNDDAVKAAETFNDNMTKLQEAGTGLANKLAGPVVQSLADASSYFIKVANDVGIARASLITFGAAFARAAGLDDVGRMTSQAKANSNAIALTVKQIETFQRLADAGDAGAATRVAQLRQQYEKLQTEGQKITSLLKNEAADIEASFTPIKGTPLMVNGIERIQSPEPIENPWVNYVVLGLSVLFEGASWLIALKAFNKEREGRPFFSVIRSSKDPTVFTVLFEDTAALLGLVVALVGVTASHLFDLPVLDGVASVVIGVILALTAGFLAIESQSLLTGEAADPDTRAGIEAIARAEPGVDGLNDARTMHFGPNEILVALSLDFRDELTAAQVEDTVARLESRIRAAYPQAGRIYVEAQSLASHAAVRAAVIAGGGAGALVDQVPAVLSTPPAL